MSNQDNILAWMNIIDDIVDEFTEYIKEDPSYYSDHYSYEENSSYSSPYATRAKKTQPKRNILLIIHKKEEGCLISQANPEYRLSKELFTEVISFAKNKIMQKRIKEIPVISFSKLNPSEPGNETVQHMWCYNIEPIFFLKLLSKKFPEIEFYIPGQPKMLNAKSA
ncbi:hypothetical protein A9Q84_14440 [Halobacteriovorax marinus]|uniref:Uncharacterized protein n=1 Tax=Halobacteriovorax marinus TaxID=97084 RepID=A0A1Y5FBC0_9BACT|nr:hypothetical protein A9Q84_14440 [Halobacteriovorax marinus]